MGKGDGRRVEDAKKIDENWARAFGAVERVIDDACVGAHLRTVMPSIYALLVKELKEAPKT